MDELSILMGKEFYDAEMNKQQAVRGINDAETFDENLFFNDYKLICLNFVVKNPSRASMNLLTEEEENGEREDKMKEINLVCGLIPRDENNEETKANTNHIVIIKILEKAQNINVRYLGFTGEVTRNAFTNIKANGLYGRLILKADTFSFKDKDGKTITLGAKHSDGE